MTATTPTPSPLPPLVGPARTRPRRVAAEPTEQPTLPTQQLGGDTHGVWTRAAALKVMTRGQLRQRVLNGEWQTIHAGVYADGGYLPDPVQLAIAAALATGDTVTRESTAAVRAVACGRTAARVHGFPLVDDDDPSTGAHEVTTGDVQTFRASSGRSLELLTGQRRLLRHRFALLDGDLYRHSSGLILTSPLRTAIDCAALLSHEAAVCVLDHGLHQRLFTRDDLLSAVAARKGWPGVQRLRAAVVASDARAESAAETLARLVLLPVLPGLVPQVRVTDERGRVVARLDLGEEEARFGVEVDGRRGHAGPEMVRKDRRRDRRTQEQRWWVERCGWHEIRTAQGELRERVVGQYRRHRT